ncbi:hypothetical protein FGO68_gene13856 [Halteria grandinella]|uniref:Uncharacterized protein n=1 Tax=Halteria grandinella TaxID=5974 RepID=A0A8J8TA06_HALGN|nr:hypothetical protein FGO68_gene13856 [Halteria grandinella]
MSYKIILKCLKNHRIDPIKQCVEIYRINQEQSLYVLGLEIFSKVLMNLASSQLTIFLPLFESSQYSQESQNKLCKIN